MTSILLRCLSLALIIGAIGGIAWRIDHNAGERMRNELAQQATRIENKVRSDLRQSEQRLALSMQKLGAEYQAGRHVIDNTRTIIKPTVTREIIREPRLSDPAAGLTDGLLGAVNRARTALGPCAATAGGGIRCPVPAPGDSDGSDDRDAGAE